MISYAVTLIAVSTFAVAAYSDFRFRRIANALVVTIGVLGIIRLSVVGNLSIVGYTATVFLVVFIVGIILFWRGLAGGGDVKLIAAATLLIGYRDALEFLLIMALVGGILAATILINDLLSRGFARAGQSEKALGQDALPRLPADDLARPTVPYGVAIAAAAILILVLQTTVPG